MSLDIIMGPMFSGKTSQVISLYGRYTTIGRSVLVIKHALDTRYSAGLTTHNGQMIPCYTTDTLNALTSSFLQLYRVIIIDEAQFFDGLYDFVKWAVEHGKTVFVVGLDGDHERKPFGEILKCIPLADKVTKLTAFCNGCRDGTPAPFTKRINGNVDQIAVGGADMYQAVCLSCYR